MRNLPKTKVLPAAYLNVVDMMNHGGVLITEEAVRIAEGLWGKASRPAAVAKPKPSAPTKAAPKAEKAAPAAESAVTVEDEEAQARCRKKAEAAKDAEVEAVAAEAEVVAEAA